MALTWVTRMLRDVPESSLTFPLTLPQTAFGPRLVARAGDVWRAMQDVVVEQSNSVGWTSARYIEADAMFVVRTMTVRHEREVRINEDLHGRTWPSRARRQMLFTRQVRLFSSDELVASATQEWAYLSRAAQPTRAGQALFDAFQIEQGFPDAELPSFISQPHAPQHVFDFTTWHGWLDANGHINHASYVDFCDEGVARVLEAEGVPARQCVPVAESVHFRAAIGAGELVTVETTEVGHAHGARVFTHRILLRDKVCATATTVRRSTSAAP
jgi:acyl-CoA thioesterase FadM